MTPRLRLEADVVVDDEDLCAAAGGADVVVDDVPRSEADDEGAVDPGAASGGASPTPQVTASSCAPRLYPNDEDVVQVVCVCAVPYFTTRGTVATPSARTACRAHSEYASAPAGTGSKRSLSSG